MKKYPYSFKHSPEKIFLAAALLCFLGYEGLFLFRTYRQGQKSEEGQHRREEIADTGISREIEALRWLAPFKTMNYQNNPFDIGFKLKMRSPAEKQASAAEVRKKKAVKKQIPKKLPPPPRSLPPVIFSVEYLGSYTNMDGIAYAVLQIVGPDKKRGDKMYLTRGEQFMEIFQLQDFNDAEIVLGVRNQNCVRIAWNEKRNISIPVKLAPQKK